MKYAEIKSEEKYHMYCNRHLELGKILGEGKGNEELENEYYIIQLIIDDYTAKQQNPFEKLTPVDLLKAIMEEYNYSGYKLSKELSISQSVISDILNYKRGFSKEIIRKLVAKFDLSPESFLKQYELINKPSNVA